MSWTSCGDGDTRRKNAVDGCTSDSSVKREKREKELHQGGSKQTFSKISNMLMLQRSFQIKTLELGAFILLPVMLHIC